MGHKNQLIHRLQRRRKRKISTLINERLSRSILSKSVLLRAVNPTLRSSSEAPTQPIKFTVDFMKSIS